LEFAFWVGTSIISKPIGSVNCYSIYRSGHGLWSGGKPSALSVSVQRIGYITITNGAVTYYKDSAQTSLPMTTQLGNHQDGFLYNDLVPPNHLTSVNLFNPNG
jgi:hypothetical protein